MRRLRASICAAALLLALAPFAVSEATKSFSQREVEEALTCQCGCGLTVATCNHLECSFAIPVRKDIAESLARGESGEQILERYKKEYGEKVLSSPIPQGFNLLAWIGPYFAIFVAGLVMYGFLRSRASSGGSAPEVPLPSPSPSPSADPRMERLQQEVDELER